MKKANQRTADLKRKAERNKIRHLKQAAELIEEWQLLLQGVQPVNDQTPGHEEVVLGERQR